MDSIKDDCRPNKPFMVLTAASLNLANPQPCNGVFGFDFPIFNNETAGVVKARIAGQLQNVVKGRISCFLELSSMQGYKVV